VRSDRAQHIQLLIRGLRQFAAHHREYMSALRVNERTVYNQKLWCPNCGRRGEAQWAERQDGARPGEKPACTLDYVSSGFRAGTSRDPDGWPLLICGCGTTHPPAFFGRNASALRVVA
jgi:hypothetical protein